MTKKQRDRINVLLLAGADITRQPRRRMDAELYELLAAVAGHGQAQAKRGQDNRASRPPTTAGRKPTERVQYAALYMDR